MLEKQSLYKKLLDESGEFTVNIFLNNFDKNIIGVCGTKSGRDTDKIKDLNSTLIEPEIVDVP